MLFKFIRNIIDYLKRKIKELRLYIDDCFSKERYDKFNETIKEKIDLIKHYKRYYYYMN